MTDSLPPPENPPEPPSVEPDRPHDEQAPFVDSPPPRKRPDPLPILFGIGIIVLLAAVFYLWQHPLGEHLFSGNTQPPGTASPAPRPASVAQVEALQQQLDAAQRRLDAAQQQAQTAQQQAQSAQQQAEALQQRVDALEKRPVPVEPDLGPLEARIAALEKRVEQPAPLPPEVANLGPRLDALSTRLEQLAAREEQLATQEQQLATHEQQLAGQVQDNEAAVGKRLETIEGRIGTIEQQAGQLSGLADRAGRVARIQAAEAALDAGLPIGNLPDAPPALARFATVAPPTVASLRLAFPAAAQAAEAAAGPETGRTSFWQGVRRRVESLVTVRRGDQVIVGNPAEGTIARAARALDAGDLAGAVAAISQLQGAPAQAFAAWREQAEALLDARRALAALAAHAAVTTPLPNRA